MERYLHYGRKFLASFTAVFTCVILASAVFIGIFSNPYLPLRLIGQALILASASALLNFIYVSEKPIRKRSMWIRTAAHFTALLALVLLCTKRFDWFSFSHRASLLTFLLLFAAVYAAIWAASFIGDLLDERKINRRLAALREGRFSGETKK